MTCNGCEFLTPTEDEQNSIKQSTGKIKPHTCLKYKRIVLHYPLTHPMINPCDECISERRIKSK